MKSKLPRWKEKDSLYWQKLYHTALAERNQLEELLRVARLDLLATRAQLNSIKISAKQFFDALGVK